MPSISVVIPVHNEERNIPLVFKALTAVFLELPAYTWDVVFVDDGSTDASLERILALSAAFPEVHYIELSRNFGKEVATTAGLHEATGDAVIMMDADLQHPPVLIPEFVAAWEKGADVVIGVRRKNKNEGFMKCVGSWVFNKMMRLVSETAMVERETDFRLISQTVLAEYRRFTERDRMTRALLNWLGFRRTYIEFDAEARMEGEASYSTSKLIHLALSYFLSHTQILLKLAGYLGAMIMIFAFSLGSFIFVEKYILLDPWNLNFSGPAILAVINLFLAGVMLFCLGLVALHVGSIHREVMNRPLYVVRGRKV
jgi:dolichol-phosphate mannosyltransferase